MMCWLSSKIRTRRPRLLLGGLGLLIWLVYIISPVYNVFDSRWTLQTALSLLKEHDVDLDEYASHIEPGDYRIQIIDGHFYNIYPVGPALIAAPFLAILRPIASNWGGIDLDSLLAKRSIGRLEIFIASFTVALTAVILAVIAYEMLDSWPLALLGAGLFAFGTSAWSAASRGLWQHGPAMLMLTIALWLFVRAGQWPPGAWLAALPLGLSFVMRPNCLLALIVFSLYVWREYREQRGHFFILLGMILGLFVGFNYAVWGAFLPYYYWGHKLENLAFRQFLWGFLGALVSPGRGLFIYSPVFLFSIAGVWTKMRQKCWRRLDTAISVFIILYLASVASWNNWWGGHCYGPRLLAEIQPFLIYFLFPILPILLPPRNTACQAGSLVFALCALISVAMHGQGACNWATLFWNAFPIDIDVQPQRLWDWPKAPFLCPWLSPPHFWGTPTPQPPF